MTKLKTILLVILLAAVLPAFAQEAESQAPADAKPTATQNVKKDASGKKVFSIQFEDEMLSGENPKPEVEFIFQRKSFNYQKMIRLRQNFIPEATRAREMVNEAK